MVIRKKFFAPIKFYKELIQLVFPIALQQLLSTGMAFLQTLLIGNWAKNSLGMDASEVLLSIQIGNRFFISMNALLMAISITCSLFFAQYNGAKEEQKMKETAKANIIFSMLFAFLFVILGVIFRHQIVQAFYKYHNVDSDYMAHSERFYLIIIFSLIPLSITHGITYMLRNLKMTKIPLLATGISFVFHAGLSSCFLYFTSLGTIGVAWSFLITRIIEMGILLIAYHRQNTVVNGFMTTKHYREMMKNIFHKGWPVFLSQLLQEALTIMMFMAYAKIQQASIKEISAITFTQQVVDVCYAIIGGMGTATAIFIGEPIGQNKVEEAKNNGRYLLSYIIVFSLGLSLMMLVFLPIYQSITEKNIFFVQVFLLQTFTMPLLFYSQNIMFILRSSGYTKSNLWINILPAYLIKVPLVVIFVFINNNLFLQNQFFSDLLSALSLTPNLIMLIFLGERVVEIIRGVVAFSLFHRVKWYERSLKGNRDYCNEN